MTRGALLTVTASGALALAALAAACTEQFPAPTPAAADAGVPADGPLEPEPPAIVAPDRRVNAASAPVAFDPLRGGVWTANGDVGTVSYVDPAARAVVQEIAIGGDVRSVAVSPDGAWVAAVDRDGATVTLLDAQTRAVRRVLPLSSHPRACVWDVANPRWLYVVEEDAGALVVVDRTLGAIVASIPVGRLPSGIAASASHRELYVAHRVDGDVTVIDLGERAVAADVLLADEPFTAAAVPNGKPLGFEAPAVTTDGSHVWVPHELLASTHPIVFSETLFPAISVVDAQGRVEQETDPNTSQIAGRKNLFGAIDLTQANGQPAIFSQLCAVAMHPNNLTAWALACGSEDLLTFDVGAGVATDVIRGLPCQHPAGMTLDDTGQRIFVLCDQSKQLLTLDTAGGSLAQHATLYGAPISIAVDTVAARDPQLRTGRRLFFDANSSTGELATTGNDWMSCGGCHLDGFGATSARLFEALLPPADEARDAQIGHVGLADHFATAVQSQLPSFDPHDLLVALLDQGGLAPDRSGASHAGQVDPSSPPSAAVQMAQALARVVAGDLPDQPSWLHAEGGPPQVQYDQAWCGQGQCHPSEYAEWSASVHAHSALDAMVRFAAAQEPPTLVPLCSGCHDPVTVRAGGDALPAAGGGRGVTCLGCHDVTALVHGGGNADMQATSHDWTADHKAWGLASLQLLRQPAFCGTCHRQFVPGGALVALSTLDEYQSSLYAPSTLCVDCHMPPVTGGSLHSHRFPGGNVYLGQQIGDATLVAEQTTNLTHVVDLSAERVAGGALVTIRNGGAGHGFPTGVTDLREPWVELQPTSASGQVLAHLGGPASPADLLPPGAARLGIDLAAADGTVLLLHQLDLATRIPFDVRVPSGESQALFVPAPSLPSGTAWVDAVLYYRNVRTTFFRSATGTTGAAPSIEMARVRLAWSSP